MSCSNSCSCCVPCSTLLSVSKFVAPSTAFGSTGATGTFSSVTFVIFVKNIGKYPACDVIILDCLPISMTLTTVPPNAVVSGTKITIPLGTLQPGQLVTLIISGNPTPGIIPGTYTNQVTASSQNSATVVSAASFSIGV